MNWLHACYSLGAMLGPLLMTGMIAWAGSWRLGYMVVAGTLLALSLLFIATKAQWNDADRIGAAASTEIKPARSITATEALRIKAVWLHIILFFVCTGLEISLGQWSFTVLTESRNIGVSSAGVWVTIYWASILAGRILFGFVVDRVGIDTLIRLSLMAALIGTALFAWNPWPWSSPVALGLAGLGLAVIYPSLMTRTPERFGKQVALHAIGFQVAAAMLGGAVLPGMTGFIAQHTGLHVVAGTLCLTAAFLFALHEFVLFKTAGLANRLITYLG